MPTPASRKKKSASPTSVSEGGVGSQSVTSTYPLTKTTRASSFPNTPAPTDIDTLSLHDALPIYSNGLLDQGETWVYTLTVTAPTQNAGTSHTNTATASGSDDEIGRAHV